MYVSFLAQAMKNKGCVLNLAMKTRNRVLHLDQIQEFLFVAFNGKK